MAASVLSARTEYVLFMEDDWVFHVLRFDDWPDTISAALGLLRAGTAQFVR